MQKSHSFAMHASLAFTQTQKGWKSKIHRVALKKCKIQPYRPSPALEIHEFRRIKEVQDPSPALEIQEFRFCPIS